MLNWLWDAIDAVLGWVMNLVDAVWTSVWGWVSLVFDQVGAWILSTLPVGWQDEINGVVDVLETIRVYMNVVDFWIPIYGSLAIIGVTAGMVAQIRLIRLILRVAPVVNG